MWDVVPSCDRYSSTHLRFKSSDIWAVGMLQLCAFSSIWLDRGWVQSLSGSRSLSTSPAFAPSLIRKWGEGRGTVKIHVFDECNSLQTGLTPRIETAEGATLCRERKLEVARGQVGRCPLEFRRMAVERMRNSTNVNKLARELGIKIRGMPNSVSRTVS